MTSTPRFCEQCGAALPPNARFCERCGRPVSLAARPAPMPAPTPVARPAPMPAPALETVIGHLPVRIEKGGGLFGRPKASQLDLVITTSRLLFLHETDEINENWVYETERLSEEEESRGLPWRKLVDEMDWRGPLWAVFYDTPPDELLAAHPGNQAIPLAEIASALVALAEDWDRLDLRLSNGETPRFLIFNRVGSVAARFLAQALGRERVQLELLED